MLPQTLFSAPASKLCTHCLTGAGSSSAAPDTRIVQRRALLHHLGLSTSHYLQRQPQGQPQGAGQAAPLAIEALLNTAAICLMPDHLAYHWWQAPGAFNHHQPLSPPAATATAVAANLPAVAEQHEEARPVTRNGAAWPIESATSPKSGTGTDLVPGTVEVKPSFGVISVCHTAGPTACGTQPAAPSKVLESAAASSMHMGTVQGSTDTGRPSAYIPAPPQLGRGDGSPFVCSPVYVQLQVLHSLRRLLVGKLSAIAGGSAGEDRELVKQPGVSVGEGIALVYRAGQKELACAALDALSRQTGHVVCMGAAALRGQFSLGSSLGQDKQPEEEVGVA